MHEDYLLNAINYKVFLYNKMLKKYQKLHFYGLYVPIWDEIQYIPYRRDADMDIPISYSKVSNKRTVFNNRTGSDIILQKV